MNWNDEQTNQSAGFTLVEMVVVLIIIAILIATGVIAISGVFSNATSSALGVNVEQANLGIANYYLSNNQYPTLTELAGTFAGNADLNSPAAAIVSSKGTLTWTTNNGTFVVYCYTGANCSGNPADTGGALIQSCCST